MGKKDHGRLVHEVRDALIRRGFRPSSVIRLDAREGPRGVRIPGFQIAKHNDGKSVRLFHRANVSDATPADGWDARQFAGRAHMTLLVRYNAVLEQEGFTCVAINSRDPLAPYSLWRRSS